MNATLGAAMGAAMLCGACGPTTFVSAANSAGTSTADSALKLDIGSTVNPAAPVSNALYVKSATLVGIYSGCLGQTSGTTWRLTLSQGNSLVKVAQLDQSCQLRATGLEREVWNKLEKAEGGIDPILIVEKYEFHEIELRSNGAQYVRDLAAPVITNGLRQQNTADIIIRDGYIANNLRMAVRSDNTAMSLVNIAGTNTGAQGTGAGGYSNDFEVNVLSGATASELFNTGTSSQINYSVNLQASAKELPAPTYVIDAATVRVAVDPTGVITPASTGTFKLVVATKNFLAQPGTEYIMPQPTDGQTCQISYAAIDGCGTSSSDYVDPTVLPSDTAYTNLNEAEQYSALFGRWQLLRALGRRVQNITTSDKSISLPVLSLFPPGTRLFSLNALQTGYDRVNNTQVVVIRNRASGSAGSDFDAASGVQSFQAFQITVAPPSIH